MKFIVAAFVILAATTCVFTPEAYADEARVELPEQTSAASGTVHVGLEGDPRIELGADSATITVDVDGTTESISIGYADMLDTEGPVGGYSRWILLGAAGAYGVKLLRLLLKLGALS